MGEKKITKDKLRARDKVHFIPDKREKQVCSIEKCPQSSAVAAKRKRVAVGLGSSAEFGTARRIAGLTGPGGLRSRGAVVQLAVSLCRDLAFRQCWETPVSVFLRNPWKDGICSSHFISF